MSEHEKPVDLGVIGRRIAVLPFEDQTCWTHDEKSDAWYFHLHPKSQYDSPVAKSVELGSRMVILDYDENGQVIGVEVL